MSDPLFINGDQAARQLKTLGDEFALIKNPSYVHPAFDVYPLAPKRKTLPAPTAIVMDMDGTTTTTETLCLHSLETMVRRITNRHALEEWPGLDPETDYPHVIGNSTTRHVEYLIQTYGRRIQRDAFARALLEAAVWTLTNGKDERRKREVSATFSALNWQHVLNDPRIERMLNAGHFDAVKESLRLDKVSEKHRDTLAINDFASMVRGAIDIYYYRYHEILGKLAAGDSRELSDALTGGKRLIEPMPGVAVTLALVKGWLGEKAGELVDILIDQSTVPLTIPDRAEAERRLAGLGTYFASHPLKVAVVTSSIKYEADIVLREVFSVIREQIASWLQEFGIAEQFHDPYDYYDAFITADDSSEIRLKPHRDLYSIALHAMGVPPDDIGAVIGFEDSEPGTIAIRAAGIGLCVAVPFSDTTGHDLSAAAHILHGGLPQALLEHGLFIDNQ